MLLAGAAVALAPTAQAAPPAQGAITLDGSPVMVKVNAPGKTTQLNFAGTNGQRVSVVATHSTVGPACPSVILTVQRPDNSQLGFPSTMCGTDGFVDTQTLDVDGTWSILVTPQGSDTGHLTIQAYAVTDQVGAIVRNAIPVPVSITTPGQNARFTFSSVAGQRLSSILSASTFGAPCGAVDLSLVRPDGSPFGNVAQSCKKIAFLDSQALDANGTWALLVDPQGSTTGTANLTAYNTNDSTGLTKSDGSTFVVPKLNPGQNATIHFTGSTGQRVSALVTKATYGCPGVALSLLRPDGSAFGDRVTTCTKSTFLDAQALDQDGVWSVLVDPLEQAVGTAQLQVWDAGDATKPITLNGAPIKVDLKPGQQGVYSFTGTVGQKVSATVTGAMFAGCPGYALRFVRPDGSVLGSLEDGCGNKAFLDSQKLDRNGNWTLVIDPVGSAHGTATLNGWTFADDDGTADLSGKPAFLDFTRPGQNATWTFKGKNGQKVSAYVTESSLQGCDFTLELVRPNGTVLGAPVNSCAETAYLETLTLDRTGKWKVIVDPAGTNMGEATLRVFNVVDASGKFKPGPDIRTFTTEAPGVNAAYQISGKSGDVRTVTITSSTYENDPCPSLVVSLKRPDGSVLTSAQTCGSTLTISGAVLDATGTWTLLVDPQGPATGTMIIRLT